MRAVAQYLQRYAETASSTLDLAALAAYGPWRHALVIPAYDESAEFCTRLQQSPLWQEALLAVVVVNQPAQLRALTPANRALLEHFTQFSCLWQEGEFSLYRAGASSWLRVDATARLAPTRKEGVGLARKLGCDLAVHLWHAGLITSPWLHSSDADAELPADYFAVPEATAAAAGTYHFTHVHADPAAPVLAATRTYEQAIRYYAASLAWAGSPFAFTALGSALAVKFAAYCAVRGFPQKAGGEDFYLLNKLVKQGPVVPLAPTVRIQARLSTRVPFGTGPATAAILAGEAAGEPYCYYHPDCFRALQQWLEIGPQLWREVALLQALPRASHRVLQRLGLARFIAHQQRQVRSAEQAQRSFHTWFDGFLTLKFVHGLEAEGLARLPLAQCMAQAVYL